MRLVYTFVAHLVPHKKPYLKTGGSLIKYKACWSQDGSVNKLLRIKSFIVRYCWPVTNDCSLIITLKSHMPDYEILLCYFRIRSLVDEDIVNVYGIVHC